MRRRSWPYLLCVVKPPIDQLIKKETSERCLWDNPIDNRASCFAQKGRSKFETNTQKCWTPLSARRSAPRTPAWSRENLRNLTQLMVLFLSGLGILSVRFTYALSGYRRVRINVAHLFALFFLSKACDAPTLIFRAQRACRSRRLSFSFYWCKVAFRMSCARSLLFLS